MSDNSTHGPDGDLTARAERWLKDVERYPAGSLHLKGGENTVLLIRDLLALAKTLEAERGAAADAIYQELNDHSPSVLAGIRALGNDLHEALSMLAEQQARAEAAEARNKELEAERYNPDWMMPALIAHVRSLGCKCVKPLIGYSTGYGPRCRLCNVDSEDRIKAREREVAALKGYVQHKPECERGQCSICGRGSLSAYHTGAVIPALETHDYAPKGCTCGLAAALKEKPEPACRCGHAKAHHYIDGCSFGWVPERGVQWRGTPLGNACACRSYEIPSDGEGRGQG